MDYPGSILIIWVLKSREPFLTVVRERDLMPEAGPQRCKVAGFAHGPRGLRTEQCGRTLEARKGKETFSVSSSTRKGLRSHQSIRATTEKLNRLKTSNSS